MIRNTYRALLLALLLGLVLVPGMGCPESGTLDDEDGPPVVFEIEILDTPAVQTARDAVAGCAAPVFTVQEWQAQAQNKPKNAQAITSPFNDIELLDVTFIYTCDAALAASCPPQRTFGQTGTVPADGSIQFSFFPIALQDLNIPLSGTTINIDMRFRARAISGETLIYDTGDQLAISGCI